ncbi:kinase domain protein, putative (macronuclear) [Tetrahymena thermophila SB210]|uniref:Kinase domain protein, putative n=1 Tax=Tetrahymena thermophila (strain SB210) TaxID=312017 RepID=Q228G2_TETTS|nr:kinase domain protein, putative [Tetrahymena thermophila SB210]EAR81680.2 kinase domain protein, putative [Tetrahymena thermophila SB210]|eukprot:XP_001029343.2 kinase domain protein, putative [Tetrahymena thermophila SB210]
MEEQQILNEQKGKQPQSSTITQQTTPQSGRYQTLKQIICTKEQNEESKKNQPIQQIISTNNKFQMNKRENSLQAEGIYITKSYISPEFGQEGVERYQTLKQIICTKEQNEESDHINSGGEADIFTNQNDDNIVYRVIKLNEDKDLRKQEQELQRFQELQEQNILNINSSYLIENQVIIYSIQKYIYHSDIKPGNILKIDDNNYQLSDFGASQQVDFIDPFCDYEMYTPDFKPKKREKNLPFYHDIYSFVIKTFLEEYLKQIEHYLVIKKENKVFQYESQYQYAEIAILIIQYLRKEYKESLECINEIFREDFKDNSQSEILIKSIRIVTKILIKLAKQQDKIILKELKQTD